MDDFIRGHPFYLLQQTSSFTTSQRKAFEMDVFQQARELEFSSANAEKQIVHARRLCGEKEYHGSRSKLDNEVSDSETVTMRDSIANVVDRDRVENSSSTCNLPSVRSFQDAKSTKSSHPKNAESVLEDQAAGTLGKVQRKREKRRRRTSSAGAESTFPKTQAHSNSKQADPSNQHSSSQNRLQDSKSDTVNGDPSQLLEVPEDVSWYLEAQAKKKRAKKERLSSTSTLDVDMRDVQNESPNDNDLEDNNHTTAVSRQAHDMNEKLRKDGISEKQTDRRERGRQERKSRNSSVEPSNPKQERTIDERAEKKARKRERRLARRQLAKANLDSGATSPGPGLQASVDPMRSTKKAQNEIFDEIHNLRTDKSAENDLDMRKSLDEIPGETVPHPRKHKKKKHKPKNKSRSKESGFQSPMIQ